jgi:RsiW-degrading membrane proteinase PrsW (M82 family)
MLGETWRAVGLLTALAVFWVAYADLKDRQSPEPRRRLIQAFGLGLLACALALGVFRLLAAVGIVLPDAGGAGTAAYCLGVIGPVEEGIKFLAFVLVIRHWAECDEPIDGYVYASAIGCGFATLENAIQLPGMTSLEQLARAAVLPICHALYGAMWGLAITRPGATWVRIGGMLVVSMLIHGLYDWVVIEWHALATASGIVLVMWIAVLLRVRHLVPQVGEPVGPHHPRWGYVVKAGAIVMVGLAIWLGGGCARTSSTTSIAQADIETRETPLRIAVSASSLRARQGGTLAPLIRFDEPVAQVAAYFGGAALPIYPVIGPDGQLLYRGMVGIWVKREPGTVPLTIAATDLAGITASRTVEVVIERTDFERGGRVRIPAAKKRSMAETERRRSSQASRNAAYAVHIPTQLWLGPFLRPTTGERTSSFGKFRTYNTGVQRHHLGVDIGTAKGTKVVAANHGVVTLSELQHTFGHVVIVNHGQGMSTSYNHLSKRLRRAGDRVRKGDPVGLVGSTGLSTGPHLHWGMEVGGFAVDAEQWQSHGFDGHEASDFR